MSHETSDCAALVALQKAESYLQDLSAILSDAGVLALTVRGGVIELRERAEQAEAALAYGGAEGPTREQVEALPRYPAGHYLGEFVLLADLLALFDAEPAKEQP